MNKGWIVAGAMLACGLGARAADFTNLDFEAYAGSGDDVLPGWERSEGYYIWPLLPDTGDGGCPLNWAGLGLGSSNYTCGSPLEGSYSAFFSTGLGTWHYDEQADMWVYGECGSVSIWQTAQVPTNAQYVRFQVREIDNATLGAISLVAGAPESLANGALRYTTDIQALAGQEATLTFSADNGSAWNEGGQCYCDAWHYWLDQIEFLDAGGTVIWPPPRPGMPICLEDFHAATLNTSLWVEASSGAPVLAGIQFSNDDGYLRIYANSAAEPFEKVYGYQAALRGDWDVRLDFTFWTLMTTSANEGVLGMALAAEFGPDRFAQARVGQWATISNRARFCAVDWGQGPTNAVAETNQTGVFRLVRTGWEVAGYVWDVGSNDWRIVGTAGGYTDEVARVGLKVWSTGALGGKGFNTYADNLILANGHASLDGLAIRTFGLDENGAPSIDWDAVGIPTTNRYVVTRATSLVDSAWTPVSGGIPDAGGTTNWTGAGGASGPFYYRVESVPGP